MKTPIVILFAIFVHFCFSQKQGNIWYFGKQSGINFSGGTPVSISNGQTGTDLAGWEVQEGVACVADSFGNILFYTGGRTIWNKNHSPMPNGTGLMGGVSSTQSSLVVPRPGSSNIFYVFTSDEFQSYPSSKGYRYSVVDMCLDNGRGDIIPGQKNILLCDSSTEKLSACKDASGTGYWVVGHKMFSNEFHAWHLTSAGITSTVVSKSGTVHGLIAYSSTWITGAAQGEMKFNPSGTKIALAIGNYDPAYLDLFDFNNSTGIVSSFCHMVLDSMLNKRIWGCEFSPDGSKLYTGVSGGSGGRRLYQFEMNAGNGNCDSISSSRFQLFRSSDGPMYGMQVAPNGKIYLVINYWDLSCINNPNLLGVAANFDTLAIAITGQNNYELPNFIAGYKYQNGLPPCSFYISTSVSGSKCSNQCDGTATVSPLGGTSPFKYIWSNGQTAQTAIGLCAGNYVVTVSDAAAITTTAAVTITQPPTLALVASVTANTCAGSSTGSALVSATGGTPGYAYSWSNGQVTQTASGLSAGLHTVTVTDANGCVGTDSVSVSVFPSPTVTITGNTTVCSGQNVALIASGGQTYIWNTGDTTNLLIQSVFSNSTYSVTVTDVNGCSATGMAVVTANPVPVMTVTGGGTIIQGQATQLVAGGTGTFLWTPETGLSCTSCPDPFASPKVKTTYCVLLTDSNNCTDTACVTIDINCGEIFIPSVFSPNNDGENDVEYVRGKCIRSLYFAIYDRWGEKVFETNDQAIGWDGVFGGKPCSNDVYTYYCNITMTDGSVVSKKGTVTLTR